MQSWTPDAGRASVPTPDSTLSIVRLMLSRSGLGAGLDTHVLALSKWSGEVESCLDLLQIKSFFNPYKMYATVFALVGLHWD